jgi:prepilin-type N-terminal cleavage/methylation domain-containing protein
MKKYNKGFTLLEMSVVIVVMSFLLVGTVDITTGLLNSARQSDTVQRLRVIDKAIEAYITSNRKLPCPAGILLTPKSASYGVESCTANAVNGIKESGKILYGTIPVEELKLSKKYIADGWDVKFLYLVVKDYTANPNDFFSKNVADNDLINSKFSYAVISHGKNKIGAIYYDGGSESPKGIDTATAGEKKNIYSMFSGNTIQEYRDVQGYDDIVIAKNRDVLARELDLVDSGCIIGNDIGTTILNKCAGSSFSFTGTNIISGGNYLEYKVRKYSNTVETAENGGVLLKRQCVVECGGYGVVNVYLLEKEG